MRFEPDRCPHDGCPPRAFKAQLNCSVPLERLDRNSPEFMPRYDLLRRHGKAPEVPETVTLVCGGGHRWEARVIQDEDEDDDA